MPYKFLSLPNIDDESNTKLENTSESNDSVNHSDENVQKITEVIRNVRWLITEGYVTEYSNGKVWVHPRAEINNSSKKQERNISSTNTDGSSKTDNTNQSSGTSAAVKKVEIMSEEKNDDIISSEDSEAKNCESHNVCE